MLISWVGFLAFFFFWLEAVQEDNAGPPAANGTRYGRQGLRGERQNALRELQRPCGESADSRGARGVSSAEGEAAPPVPQRPLGAAPTDAAGARRGPGAAPTGRGGAGRAGRDGPAEGGWPRPGDGGPQPPTSPMVPRGAAACDAAGAGAAEEVAEGPCLPCRVPSLGSAGAMLAWAEDDRGRLRARIALKERHLRLAARLSGGGRSRRRTRRGREGGRAEEAAAAAMRAESWGCGRRPPSNAPRPPPSAAGEGSLLRAPSLPSLPGPRPRRALLDAAHRLGGAAARRPPQRPRAHPGPPASLPAAQGRSQVLPKRPGRLRRLRRWLGRTIIPCESSRRHLSRLGEKAEGEKGGKSPHAAHVAV